MGVWAEELILMKLLMHIQKNSVHDKEFRYTHAVKTVDPIEDLAFIHEGANRQTLKKIISLLTLKKDDCNQNLAGH